MTPTHIRTPIEHSRSDSADRHQLDDILIETNYYLCATRCTRCVAGPLSSYNPTASSKSKKERKNRNAKQNVSIRLVGVALCPSLWMCVATEQMFALNRAVVFILSLQTFFADERIRLNSPRFASVCRFQ